MTVRQFGEYEAYENNQSAPSVYRWTISRAGAVVLFLRQQFRFGVARPVEMELPWRYSHPKDVLEVLQALQPLIEERNALVPPVEGSQ